MPVRFALNNVSFATREKAEQLIDEVKSAVASKEDEQLLLDLKNVKVVSPSFASGFIDEIEWLLRQPHVSIKSVVFANANPLVKSRFLDALKRHQERSNNPRVDKVLVS